jgi:hypothetical protein
MLKTAMNYAVFGAFLIIVGFLGFFLWQTLFTTKENARGSEQTEITQGEQKAGKKHTFGTRSTPSSANPTEEAIADYTKWLAIFTLFLVLATIALFISGERNVDAARDSSKAAKDSADVAREALVSTNRAFISPKFISTLSHRFDDAKDKYWYSIIPIWENSGNTPTRDMTIYVNSYFEPTPMPPDFRFPPFIGSKKIPIFAGPKATFGGSFIGKTGDELAEVKAGTKFFYMWGEARYRDIFVDTPEHITRFAYQVTVLGDPTKAPSPDNVIQMTTTILPRHNCADEECERQDQETKNAGLSEPS